MLYGFLYFQKLQLIIIHWNSPFPTNSILLQGKHLFHRKILSPVPLLRLGNGNECNIVRIMLECGTLQKTTHKVYLKYVAPDDIHIYSIDEVFIVATHYLGSFHISAHDFVMQIILDVLKTTDITATAGIGPNLYLAKVAMDVWAKHVPADENGVRIAELDEMSYREKLWNHRPLTDFWRVGAGYTKSWKPWGCIPWTISPGVLSANPRIFIMRTLCMMCSA